MDVFESVEATEEFGWELEGLGNEDCELDGPGKKKKFKEKEDDGEVNQVEEDQRCRGGSLKDCRSTKDTTGVNIVCNEIDKIEQLDYDAEIEQLDNDPDNRNNIHSVTQQINNIKITGILSLLSIYQSSKIQLKAFIKQQEKKKIKIIEIGDVIWPDSFDNLQYPFECQEDITINTKFKIKMNTHLNRFMENVNVIVHFTENFKKGFVTLQLLNDSKVKQVFEKIIIGTLYIRHDDNSKKTKNIKLFKLKFHKQNFQKKYLIKLKNLAKGPCPKFEYLGKVEEKFDPRVIFYHMFEDVLDVMIKNLNVTAQAYFKPNKVYYEKLSEKMQLNPALNQVFKICIQEQKSYFLNSLENAGYYKFIDNVSDDYLIEICSHLFDEDRKTKKINNS